MGASAGVSPDADGVLPNHANAPLGAAFARRGTDMAGAEVAAAAAGAAAGTAGADAAGDAATDGVEVVGVGTTGELASDEPAVSRLGAALDGVAATAVPARGVKALLGPGTVDDPPLFLAAVAMPEPAGGASLTARADCGSDGVPAPPERDLGAPGLTEGAPEALAGLGWAVSFVGPACERGEADEPRDVARGFPFAEGELDASDAAAPAEPVVSAAAMAGRETIAAPTPSATASAPTRPT